MDGDQGKEVNFRIFLWLRDGVNPAWGLNCLSVEKKQTLRLFKSHCPYIGQKGKSNDA
jgi:hypothetical protein